MIDSLRQTTSTKQQCSAFTKANIMDYQKTKTEKRRENMKRWMGEDYLVFLIIQDLGFQMKFSGCKLRINKQEKVLFFA